MEMNETKEQAAQKKITLICSRNTIDGAYPPLILALQAVRKGADTNVFFTFMGIEVIKRGGAEKVKFFPPGLMGVVPGMPALATKMMLNMAEKRAQVPSPAELLEMCLHEGVKLWACKMTMQMMDLTEKDLVEGAQITDAANYIDMALESNLSLFI